MYFNKSWNFADPSVDFAAQAAEARLELEARPDSASAWVRLGHACHGLYYLQVSRSPKDPPDIRQDPMGAVAALRRAIELDPVLPEPYYLLAQIFSGWNEDEYFPAFLQYVVLVPDDYEAHFHLGVDLYMRRDYGLALDVLRRAHELKPDEERLGEMYATVLYVAGFPDEGDVVFQRVGIDPLSWKVFRSVSFAMAANGQRAAAISMLIRGVELHYEDRKIDTMLHNVLGLVETYEPVLSWAREKVAAEPENRRATEILNQYERLDEMRNENRSPDYLDIF